MEKKRKIKDNSGKLFDATEVGFRGSGEYWNEYLLDDGSLVRLKPVVTQIYRLDGQYDADGDPIYVVRSGNVLSVSAPEALRKEDE